MCVLHLTVALGPQPGFQSTSDNTALILCASLGGSILIILFVYVLYRNCRRNSGTFSINEENNSDGGLVVMNGNMQGGK